MDVKFIGHGHIDDLPAHQWGWVFLDQENSSMAQEHRIAQLPDPPGDLLVGQSERVKGAREERYLAAALLRPRPRCKAGTGT